MKSLLLQSSILAGTIIGAGMFSLPYIFKNAGIAFGIFYLAIISAVYILIYCFYADIVLNTAGEHRFAGYAKIYLGKSAFWFSLLMTVVEMIFVLAIYLILAVSFGDLIIPAGNGLLKILIFWLMGSVALFFSLKKIAWLEFVMTIGIIGIVALLLLYAVSGTSPWDGISWQINWQEWLLPLAPVLFALSGRVAIPTLVKFNANPKAVRASIILGTIIPAIVYGLFVFSILGISNFVSEDAVSGLFGVLPQWLLVSVGILGLFALITSYVSVGLDVRNSLRFDFKLPLWATAIVVLGGPLAIYFLVSRQFLGLVGLVGGVFIGLEGIFLLVMWLRGAASFKIRLIKKVSPVILIALFTVFIFAIVGELVSLF